MYHKVGPLKCLMKITDETQPYIILLHGYGANAYDLLNIKDAFNLSQTVNWIFPEAPLLAPVSFDGSGKAWFQVDSEQLTNFIENQETLEFSNITPFGLNEALEQILEFIEALNVPLDQIFLGGFSQGALMTVETVLKTSPSLKGFLIFSGTICHLKVWKELKVSYELPFFQSHGLSDPILSYKLAKKLVGILKKKGFKGDLLSFEGAHEIPLEVIDKASEFINRYL